MTYPNVRAAELFAATHDVVRLVNKDLTANYLARDRARNRAVLIRILPETSDDNVYARFLRNAPLLERVRHPGIQQFVESGRKGDVCYFVVDFIEGETLWRRMRRTPGRALDAKIALDFARQLCDALAAAHDAGVVHGDLSPDRTIVHEDRVVITDLGIARVLTTLDRDESNGDDPTVLGNPEWLAPEQLAAAAVGFPADVYGVGSLLYLMLTGEPPFAGASAVAVVSAIVTGPRPRYDKDPAINAVIQRAMAIDPSVRFQTMRELADALRSAAKR